MTRRFRSVEKLVCLRGNGNSFLVEDLQQRFIAARILNQWASNLVKCSSEWCDWQYTYASSVARMVDNASNQGKLIPLFPISVSMSLSKYWCNTNASSVSNLAISNQRLSFDKNRQSSLYTVGKNPVFDDSNGILKALETFLKKVHKIQKFIFWTIS